MLWIIKHHRGTFVSIPIGFSSSLQLPKIAPATIIPKKFQSLSGFQVRCNAGTVGPYYTQYTVSIPIGFSSSLQLPEDVLMPLSIDVSIPIGFSSSLQHYPPVPVFPDARTVSIPIGFSSSLQLKNRGTIYGTKVQFQSLSGFQVRCNSLTDACLKMVGIVSIPIGFSSSLQPCVW